MTTAIRECVLYCPHCDERLCRDDYRGSIVNCPECYFAFHVLPMRPRKRTERTELTPAPKRGEAREGGR